MKDGKKILALIPARGGSKGVPGKNVKSLAGKPLIAHTICAARDSRYIDSIVVTTDSQEIAAVSREYGAEIPFMRPDELAGDTSRSIDAIVHARDTLREMGKRFDLIVCLQPTSPLRGSAQIDGAIDEYFDHGQIALASVAEVSVNPVLMRRIDDFGILHPLLPIGSTIRRQDMPKYYYVNGAIYINDFDSINGETSLNDNPISYVMPKERSVDIDSLEDFERADALLRQLASR